MVARRGFLPEILLNSYFLGGLVSLPTPEEWERVILGSFQDLIKDLSSSDPQDSSYFHLDSIPEDCVLTTGIVRFSNPSASSSTGPGPPSLRGRHGIRESCDSPSDSSGMELATPQIASLATCSVPRAKKKKRKGGHFLHQPQLRSICVHSNPTFNPAATSAGDPADTSAGIPAGFQSGPAGSPGGTPADDPAGTQADIQSGPAGSRSGPAGNQSGPAST